MSRICQEASPFFYVIIYTIKGGAMFKIRKEIQEINERLEQIEKNLKSIVVMKRKEFIRRNKDV